MAENNPDVMNQLATKLGLSSELQFYDVYSLDEPEQLAHIPRPALALLAIIPLTPAWDRSRNAEDAHKEPYTGSGPDEPVIWFKQTIHLKPCFVYIVHILHINVVGRTELFKLSRKGVYDICIKRGDSFCIHFARIATFELWMALYKASYKVLAQGIEIPLLFK